MVLQFRYTVNNGDESNEEWEVMTDAWNYKYIYCAATRSSAWFVNDGTMFSFTSFNGNHRSLLYYFYLSSYKVLLGYYPGIEIVDHFPLHIVKRNRPGLWLHDFIAPFYPLISVRFSARQKWADLPVNPSAIKLGTEINIVSVRRERNTGKGTVSIEKNRLNGFSLDTGNIKIWAIRSEI
jgi:hypothetical protein